MQCRSKIVIALSQISTMLEQILDSLEFRWHGDNDILSVIPNGYR